MPLNVDKLEAIRTERGWSQEEMASRLGLTSKTNYNDIVKGRKSDVRVSTLERMAKGLGVKPQELLK